MFFAAGVKAECSLRVNFIYTYNRHGSGRAMRRPLPCDAAAKPSVGLLAGFFVREYLAVR